MTEPSYHEALWRACPAPAEPADLELRLAFLRRGTARGGEEPVGESRPHAGGGGGAAKALDVGCGQGDFVAALIEAGFEVSAIDVAAEPLERLRARYPGLEVDLRVVPPAGPWPFDDAVFDLAWAGETIEHVADTAAWLSELRRVLRSGAKLLLTTPDHGPLRMLSLALSRRRLGSHFDPRSDHLRFYTRGTLAQLLDDFGFEDIRIRAAGGPPGARRTLLAEATRSRF